MKKWASYPEVKYFFLLLQMANSFSFCIFIKPVLCPYQIYLPLFCRYRTDKYRSLSMTAVIEYDFHYNYIRSSMPFCLLVWIERGSVKIISRKRPITYRFSPTNPLCKNVVAYMSCQTTFSMTDNGLENV